MAIHITGFWPEDPHHTATKTWHMASQDAFPMPLDGHSIRATAAELSFLCSRLEGIRKPSQDAVRMAVVAFFPASWNWTCPHDIKAVLDFLRQYDEWSRGDSGGGPINVSASFPLSHPGPTISEIAELTIPEIIEPPATTVPTDPLACTGWPQEIEA